MKRAHTRRTSPPARFTAILEKSWNRLWASQISVPEKLARGFIDGGSRCVLFPINGSQDLQRGLVPSGNGSYVITVNWKWRTSLGVAPGISVQVALRKDDSAYGLPLPEELEELLRQDHEGRQFFHVLTAGG